MDRFAYPGILFLITLENVFPPIPSELILPIAGFMPTFTGMKEITKAFFLVITEKYGKL